VVIIAFSAMLLASLGFFTTLGPGLAVAVAVMLLAALTLIPALLALTGPRVFWPSKSWQRPPRATTFGRLGRLVARILMIARLREEAADGNPPREAAALAVEHAGPSVVSAGVILPGTRRDHRDPRGSWPSPRRRPNRPGTAPGASGRGRRWPAPATGSTAGP
jgi:uncharacterized membrane protein YdfJ with MMPL/SSD domain